VRRVDRVYDYVARPVGAYHAVQGALHFFFEETLCGTVFWGRPDVRAVVALTRAIDAELPSHTPPHRAFVDATRLTGVDPEAFQALVAFLGPRAETYDVNVTQQAIVRPAGVLGALVAGFYDVTRSASPQKRRIFEDAGEALAWLGLARAPQLLAEIDAAQATAGGTPAEVRALHAFVLAHPRAASLASAARALGLEPRALRASLRASGTSFRHEVNVARVRAAEAILASSDTKLGAVAAAVGCASLQHFSTLFRKINGQSPSAWRALHRR